MSILDKVKEASKKAKGLSKNGSKKDSGSKSKKGSSKVEKKMIRKSKADGELDDLMDFSDIDSMMKEDSELSGLASEENQNSSGSDSGLGKRVAGLEDKLVQMEGSVKSTRSRIGNMDERLADMEQNILKLLSVYEVVKRDINPFIEGGKGVSKDDKIDPALLGIEGAELIKTPDVSDELENMDFGTDMLLSKDTESGEGMELGEMEGDLDLSDIDLNGGPDPGPSLDEPPSVDEPPSMEKETFPPEKIETPVSDLEGGADIREQSSPISPPIVKGEPRVHKRAGPILEAISYDYRTVILVMRWIEFMFERVTRDRISALLDYYKDVGWISETVKSQIMAYARGEIQNILSFEPDDVDEEVLLDSSPKQPSDYKKVSDWRLSADDHLKSLLFVTKIAGLEVNKDTFNSLEEEIKIFTRNLAGYHGV
jgi:flagellar protein FlaD